jgi:hypothetical protein
MPDPQSPADGGSLFAQATQALAAEKDTGIAHLDAAAARLRDLAPEMTAIVDSSEVRAHRGTYARCDEEAVRQQGRLFREATAANLCLLAAAVLSSLVLAGPFVLPLLGREWTRNIPLGIGLAALTLGALAALYGYRAREGDRLRRWLNMRGRAEVARLETFRAIARRAAATGPAAAVAGLALFCRHLFFDQRDWLVRRATRHRLSSDDTNRWGGLATALTFLGGSAAMIAAFEDKLSWLALAGVVGAAVMAYALNREELRRDRANADRYEEAAVALDQLSTRWTRWRPRSPSAAPRRSPPSSTLPRPSSRPSTSNGWTAPRRSRRRWRAWTRGWRSCASRGPSRRRRWSSHQPRRREKQADERQDQAARLHRHALRQEKSCQRPRDRFRPGLRRADQARGRGCRPDRAPGRRGAARRVDPRRHQVS